MIATKIDSTAVDPILESSRAALIGVEAASSMPKIVSTGLGEAHSSEASTPVGSRDTIVTVVGSV